MKTPLNTLIVIGAIITAVTVDRSWAGSVAKNPPADLTSDIVWTQPLAGFGVKTNDAYTDGNVFLTLPVWSTIGSSGSLGGSYLFIEPYTSVGDGGEVASSLGLAYRHLFSSESVKALHKKGMAGFMEEGWFVGGSLFVDMLDTQQRNSFWQLGVGAEIGNRYLELRGNYYIPLTGQKLADHRESTQSFTSSSTRYVRSGSGTGSGAPYATGNQIAQDVNFTTTAITTYRTTTIRTVTDIFEKGMEGWDAELSVLMPWLDQWMDVRVIGGYFSFDNQPFGPQSFGTGNVHGWKAGVEVRPVPAVVLSGVWYEDKRLTGGNWTVGVQLQVPLDKTWKDAFTMRRRHLVEHLAEPVHRQNDAVKIGNTKEEHSTTTTSLARVTKIISQGPGHIVLADDIIFVNNGPAVGNGIQVGSDVTGDGTAEKPVATVQTGATLAGGNSNTTGRVWSAYVQGGAGNYTGDVKVSGSTSFLGSGTGGGIVGSGGQTFGGTGPQPVLLGGITNVTSLSGTDFDNPGTLVATPVAFLGVRGMHIENGTVIDVGGTAVPIGIGAGNVATFVARSNTVINVGSANKFGAGIGVAADGSHVTNATIESNTVTASGLGIGVAVTSSSQLSATINSNNVSGIGEASGTVGIGIYSHGTSLVGAVITNNTVTDVSDLGIGLEAQSGSTMTGTVTGNTVTNPGGNGMALEARNTANLVATLSGNTITNAGEDGLGVWTWDSSLLTATVTGNTFHTASHDYVHSESFDTSTLTLTTNNNIFASAFSDALHVDVYDSSTTNFTAVGNTITDQLGRGIRVRVFGDNGLAPATLNGTITGNTVDNSATTGSYVGGIELAGTGAGAVLNIAALDNNTVRNSAIEGIVLFSTVGANVTASNITGNTITNSGTEGMRFFASSDSSLAATASANTITGSLQNGVLIDAFQDSGSTNLTLTGNTISVADGMLGINAHANNGAALTLTATENQITGGTGGFGIYLATFANSAFLLPGPNTATITATIANNTITGGAGFIGIAGQSNENSSQNTVITGNSITIGDNSTAFAKAGILLSSGDSSQMNLTIGSNTITVGNNTGVSTLDGINLSVWGFNPMNVNATVPPVNNTIGVGTGAALFMRTTGAFGAGSSIQINGTTLTPPTSF